MSLRQKIPQASFRDHAGRRRRRVAAARLRRAGRCRSASSGLATGGRGPLHRRRTARRHSPSGFRCCRRRGQNRDPASSSSPGGIGGATADGGMAAGAIGAMAGTMAAGTIGGTIGERSRSQFDRDAQRRFAIKRRGGYVAHSLSAMLDQGRGFDVAAAELRHDPVQACFPPAQSACRCCSARQRRARQRASGSRATFGAGSRSRLSERLAAIREAVSAVAEPDGAAAEPEDGNRQLAWGNWWDNWGWSSALGGWLAQLEQLAELEQLAQLVA